MEKQVTYTATNSYSTLNNNTNTTKNIWIVFHGIGYLSRYFLRYFKELPPEENYIIAPQAPSKYYLNNEYKHVGASWLTKEETRESYKSVHHYVNSVLANENLSKEANIIILGYSQGVSIAARWITQTQFNCKSLIFYAGGIPKELTTTDFDFLNKNNTEVSYILGDKDPFITPDKFEVLKERLDLLFHKKYTLTTFEGGHEVKKHLINNII